MHTDAHTQGDDGRWDDESEDEEPAKKATKVEPKKVYYNIYRSAHTPSFPTGLPSLFPRTSKSIKHGRRGRELASLFVPSGFITKPCRTSLCATKISNKIK